MESNLNLTNFYKDKVVAITGGAGIICTELCKAYCKSGAFVCILDLNEQRIKSLESELKAKGFKAKGYVCNVLDEENIKKVHTQINQEIGKIDILVNGAGGNNPKATTDTEFCSLNDLDNSYKSFFDLDKSGVEFVFNLNFLGTFLVTKEFSKDMVRKGGSILNISSMNAFTPLTKIPAYSAAKASVSNFTQWLSVYFSKLNIRVNAIAPGFFVTAQNKSLLFNPDGTPSERASKIIKNTPMGRFGEVQELVGASLFLTNDDLAKFITGVILPIDGGFNSYSGV